MFAFYFCGIQFCGVIFGTLNQQYFYFCGFFLPLGHRDSCNLVPLERTRGTLDSGIAVHSCTRIEMLISWTLGLQSIAQTNTNKQVFRMIQVYQLFNEPVPYSSRTIALYKATKEIP